VVDCKGLVSKLSKNPVPFFYYQFFTFDEHYSKTLSGPNPIFNDEITFDVKMDPKFKDYIQTTGLEIYLFDDNAPLIDSDTREEVTDMIGTALVDLTPLLKGEKVDKQFLIKDFKNRDCGSITIQVIIKDAKVVRKTKEVEYSPEFEDEFIYKICIELVK
jgi:predicted RNA methylase